MVGSGIFGIFGTALNQAMSDATRTQQWANQLKLMEIQNRYNEQMAQRNQERNKDIWDYTNYENQKKHMKAAGLNPALMYGMGGGGGVSNSGAQGQGVTQPTDRSIEMGIQRQGMGLQLEQNAEKIMNDLKLGEKGLDIQQQNVIKDYVLGFGQMAVQMATTAMKLPGGGSVIKGFGI